MQGTRYITWGHTASWQEPKYLSGSIYEVQLTLHWEAVRKDPLSVLHHIQPNWSTFLPRYRIGGSMSFFSYIRREKTY